MEYTKHHLALSIEGCLINMKGRNLNGFATDKNGHPVSGKDFRKYLRDSLKKGWKVIPMGECDNFDYQNGCLGHPYHGCELPENLKSEFDFYGNKK
jgi:hypothetical protein